MWEGGVRIYNTSGVFNNFPSSWGHAPQKNIILLLLLYLFIYLNIKLKLRPFKFLYRIEWLTNLHLRVLVNSIDKVSYGWIKDLEFNPRLY